MAGAKKRLFRRTKWAWKLNWGIFTIAGCFGVWAGMEWDYTHTYSPWLMGGCALGLVAVVVLFFWGDRTVVDTARGVVVHRGTEWPLESLVAVTIGSEVIRDTDSEGRSQSQMYYGVSLALCGDNPPRVRAQLETYCPSSGDDPGYRKADVPAPADKEATQLIRPFLTRLLGPRRDRARTAELAREIAKMAGAYFVDPRRGPDVVTRPSALD